MYINSQYLTYILYALSFLTALVGLIAVIFESYLLVTISWGGFLVSLLAYKFVLKVRGQEESDTLDEEDLDEEADQDSYPDEETE